MKQDKLDKIKVVIVFLFRILLLIAAVIATYQKNWTNLFLIILTWILIYIPKILERNTKIDFPAEYEIAILVFIYAAMFLGEVHAYYTLFWWWDIVLHISSAIIMGIFAFVLVYIMNTHSKKINLSPSFIALFSFCFAIMLGVMWELFEFALDSWLNLNMQKSGLVDTMWDLIVDSLGALVVSIVGYFYLKNRLLFFKVFTRRFYDHNPTLPRYKIKK